MLGYRVAVGDARAEFLMMPMGDAVSGVVGCLARVVLAAGADAQVLLKRLLASGAVIGKFEMVEPSLNDIFITKVTEPA